jgi:hypothetical protein
MNMNFNKLIFISILLLVIPFANAQCSYTTGTMLCNNLGEPNPYQIIRPENVKGTIEYFSYTIPSTMRLSVMMAPGTQGLQGPDYDLYTSWTANTCPYNATYKSTDCGYTFPGAGINESCSRWLNPLPAGTYWVAVHHHNGGCTGPNCGYTLKLTCEAATSTSTSTTTTTIKPQPTTTIRRPLRGAGGSRWAIPLGTSEVLNDPLVILVALIAVVVIIYGAFKFFAMPKKHI